MFEFFFFKILNFYGNETDPKFVLWFKFDTHPSPSSPCIMLNMVKIKESKTFTRTFTTLTLRKKSGHQAIKLC